MNRAYHHAVQFGLLRRTFLLLVVSGAGIEWCVEAEAGAGNFFQQQAKVVLPDGSAQDWFGGTVSSMSRNVFVAGCENDDDEALDSGSAYVFTRSDSGSWAQAAKIDASDGDAPHQHYMYMSFGHLVSAMTENAFVVGPSMCHSKDCRRERGSAVYVFTSDSGSWVQDGKLSPSDESTQEIEYFGRALTGISGSCVLVGDPGGSHGSAYVFTKSTSDSWVQADKIVASDYGSEYGNEGDFFGRAVSGIGTSSLVVGAFGSRNGQPYEWGAGAVYLFACDEFGSWLQVGKMTASDGTHVVASTTNCSYYFGQAVSGVKNNSSFVVGAKYTPSYGTVYCAAYVFTVSGSGSWAQTDKIVASGGSCDQGVHGLALSGMNGSSFLTGHGYYDETSSDNQGLAFVFTRTDSGTWVQNDKVVAPDASEGDYFGYDVSGISGTSFLVGAPGDNDRGSIHVFTSTFAAPSTLVPTLTVTLGSKGYSELQSNVANSADNNVSCLHSQNSSIGCQNKIKKTSDGGDELAVMVAAIVVPVLVVSFVAIGLFQTFITKNNRSRPIISGNVVKPPLSDPGFSDDIEREGEKKKEGGSDDGFVTCVVCMDSSADALISPCGHVCCCYSCATILQARGDKCPIDRFQIEEISRRV